MSFWWEEEWTNHRYCIEQILYTTDTVYNRGETRATSHGYRRGSRCCLKLIRLLFLGLIHFVWLEWKRNWSQQAFGTLERLVWCVELVEHCIQTSKIGHTKKKSCIQVYIYILDIYNFSSRPSSVCSFVIFSPVLMKIVVIWKLLSEVSKILYLKRNSKCGPYYVPFSFLSYLVGTMELITLPTKVQHFPFCNRCRLKQTVEVAERISTNSWPRSAQLASLAVN